MLEGKVAKCWLPQGDQSWRNPKAKVEELPLRRRKKSQRVLQQFSGEVTVLKTRGAVRRNRSEWTSDVFKRLNWGP